MENYQHPSQTYSKDQRYESVLQEVNVLLQESEQNAIQDLEIPEWPVILIMGAPRSGSTILYQYLAHTSCFSYPTNLLSRFYNSVYIGMRIQQLLTQKDQFGELIEFQNRATRYESDLGKTQGALSPHEFSYFWRQFFPVHQTETNYLPQDVLEKIDTSTFLKELAAMEYLQQKPVMMKGMLVNFNINFLLKILKNVIFIHVKRQPAHNMRSLLQAREKYNGTREEGYSFRPPEYRELCQLPPEDQVAGQLFSINKAVEDALCFVSPQQAMTVQYEEFCQNPEQTFEALRTRLASQGYEAVNPSEGLPDGFTNRNHQHSNQGELTKLAERYKRFTEESE